MLMKTWAVEFPAGIACCLSAQQRVPMRPAIRTTSARATSRQVVANTVRMQGVHTATGVCSTVRVSGDMWWSFFGTEHLEQTQPEQMQHACRRESGPLTPLWHTRQKLELPSWCGGAALCCLSSHMSFFISA